MTRRDEGRGRVVVVTGGASGIGLATAGVLAERGNPQSEPRRRSS